MMYVYFLVSRVERVICKHLKITPVLRLPPTVLPLATNFTDQNQPPMTTQSQEISKRGSFWEAWLSAIEPKRHALPRFTKNGEIKRMQEREMWMNKADIDRKDIGLGLENFDFIWGGHVSREASAISAARSLSCISRYYNNIMAGTTKSKHFHTLFLSNPDKILFPDN